MSDPTMNLLLVEDNAVDVEAVCRGLDRRGLDSTVEVASDGLEALQILREGQIDRPFLVLLDLNLPRMGGHEFLEALRADRDLADAVVLVLTTSRDQQDILACYRQHVAGYIVKGDVGPGFGPVADLLEHYWTIVELPGGLS